jgi:hypothetical protein
MNKTSGYLYAQNSLGNPSFPSAETRMAEVKQWMQWFSKRLYTMGNSEWNSSTYESYNLVGWLNVYDFALDPEVKNIARSVLDFYCLEIALHCSQGLTGGAESRGNITGWGSGEDFISWLWFGAQGRLLGNGFWSGQEYSQAMHAALSTYRPNPMVVKLARKQISLPAYFSASRPDYGQNKAALVKQNLYAERGFTLGSAMIPVTGFAGGNSQYCNWKLVSKIKPVAGANPQVVMGGSRYYNDKDGKGKTPWDQYVQHKNVLIQFNKIPSNAAAIINTDTLLYSAPVTGWKAKWLADFDLRFPNDADRNNPVGFRKGSLARNISYVTYPKTNPSAVPVATTFRNNVFFVALDSTFLAVRSLALTQPSAPADESATRSFIADNAPQGSLCGLITEAASLKDYSSFLAFQDSVLAKTSLDKSQIAADKITYKNLKGINLEATFTKDGPAPAEPIYDWGYGPTTPQIYQTTPPFLQPEWQGGVGCGTVPSLLVNGENVGYQLNNWPVLDGPGASIKDSSLLLTSDSSGLTLFYQVDYTGNLPIFSSGILTSVSNKLKTKFQVLELFPNPASQEVTARAKGIPSGEDVDVEVFSLKGDRVWNGNNIPYKEEGLKISSFDLGSGIYQVVLKTRKSAFYGRLILRK